MDDKEKVIIVGSGCAGLTAAIYAARANMLPLVIDGKQPGGQLTTTSDVENFPGFPSSVNGFELMQSMRVQAERFGTRFAEDTIVDVDFSRNDKCLIGAERTYTARSIIIATGASPKFLNIEGEKRFLGGGGVSVCATCDGMFYRGKDVVVVGGGDTACEEAAFLTKFCSKVYIVHRRDTLRASYTLQRRVLNHPKIVPLWNNTVEKIFGDKKVDGIIIKNTFDGTQQEIMCSGVFIAIGHQPNSYAFQKYLELDDQGYFLTKKGSLVATSIAGVFVAGDCADKVFRQAVTSAGTGAMAAILSEKYISQQEERKSI